MANIVCGCSGKMSRGSFEFPECLIELEPIEFEDHFKALDSERLTVAVFCVRGSVCATCPISQHLTAALDRPPAGAAVGAQAPARTFHVPLSFPQFVA